MLKHTLHRLQLAILGPPSEEELALDCQYSLEKNKVYKYPGNSEILKIEVACCIMLT